jgi:hypothetical protein
LHRRRSFQAFSAACKAEAGEITGRRTDTDATNRHLVRLDLRVLAKEAAVLASELRDIPGDAAASCAGMLEMIANEARQAMDKGIVSVPASLGRRGLDLGDLGRILAAVEDVQQPTPHRL